MSKTNTNQYVGIYHDKWGGMTHLGNIIKDGWIFQLIPDSETGENWNHAALQKVYDQACLEWEKYGLSVGKLPPDIRQRHERIHREAIERAIQQGWSAELGDDD